GHEGGRDALPLDQVEGVAGVELRLQDHGCAEDLVQGGEEGDAAVVARSTHQVDVGLGQLEYGDDLEHVGDVDSMRSPGPFRIPGGARRVDHGGPEAVAVRVRICVRIAT